MQLLAWVVHPSFTAKPHCAQRGRDGWLVHPELMSRTACLRAESACRPRVLERIMACVAHVDVASAGVVAC